MKQVKVLFVCMGNICRSPTAQGVFERLVQSQGLADRILIDSAGTHAYHIGNPPDKRSQAAAKNRGLDLSGQRARKVTLEDIEEFDYVLAMDRTNLEDLKDLLAVSQQERVRLFMTFAEHWNVDEVPDPYYGGERGFERVLDMVEDAAAGLLDHIRRHHC
ncbi:low molecular weight protein-tyrosine-phosphatase [Thiothrix subterranea]|uniref:protein-tyrosine-phosphatase n=1 Tax=Thiothrix subterranea TaxID=2735563 RepID=A0AA51R428_9GAMM|nr:low molecular weight protein-tyrosine-phosphatase [Thiothrix subterranea]MDQ5768919.1 low molecular weight protein-tyrosine-phosphatase [Thiothrix subterranea]WML86165.1 low molecular weight protein-tyrosine-phosphatase [Thiothrix subterranea]